MIGNRYSGDNLAAEFLRLVNENAPQENLEAHAKKTASLDDSDDSILNSTAGDFIVGTDPHEPNRSVSDLENKIEDFSSTKHGGTSDEEKLLEDITANLSKKKDEGVASASSRNVREVRESRVKVSADKKTVKILRGLGKIANSLREKGEDFAADVVESTALGIRSDAVKEAKKKVIVASELEKIASDLNSEKKFFASDLVSATIDRILKA